MSGPAGADARSNFGSLTAVGRSLPVQSILAPAARGLLAVLPAGPPASFWRLLLSTLLALGLVSKARARLRQFRQRRLAKAAQQPQGQRPAPSWRELLGRQDSHVVAGHVELGLVASASLVGVLVALFRDVLNGQFYFAQNSGDHARLRRLLWLFPATTAAAAFVSQVTETSKAWVALSWRRAVVRKIHDLYFERRTYYHVLNQHAGLGVPDADTRICKDVREACDAYAGIMSGVIQTTIHISMQYSTLLARIAWIDRGWVLGPPIFVCGVVPTALSLVDWGRIWQMYGAVGHLKGAFGQALARIELHCAGIFALHGEAFEHDTAKWHLTQYVDAWRALMNANRVKDFTESMLFSGLYPSGFQTLATFTAAGITSGAVLLQSSPGEVGQMDVRAPRQDVAAYFGGYIHNWWSVVTAAGTLGAFLNTWTGLTEGQASVERVVSFFASMQAVRDNLPEAKAGAFQDRGPMISFEGVSVVTPSGQRLLEQLSFQVEPGERLLICGHNGAGKSSIIRCLSALWPIATGCIARPGGMRVEDEDEAARGQEVYYLPQKPCSVIGSLSDQLTYPERLPGGLSDAQLRGWLRCVDLEYLADRDAGVEGGLGRTSGDNEADWEQLLSLGEQQALAIARLLFHHPRFAILDECTSAVSGPLEQRLFELARVLGVTCITITHRPALQAVHTRMLRLTGHLDEDGRGWELTDLPHSDELPPVAPLAATRDEALQRATDYIEQQDADESVVTAPKAAATEAARAGFLTPAEEVRRRWPSSIQRFLALVQLGLQQPGQRAKLAKSLVIIALGMRLHCDLVWQVWSGQNGAVAAALTGSTGGILAEFLSYLVISPLISAVDHVVKHQGNMFAGELAEAISERLLRLSLSAGALAHVVHPGGASHVENPLSRFLELGPHMTKMGTSLIDLLFRCSFGAFSLRTLLRGVGPVAFLSPPLYFVVFRLCLLVAPDFTFLSKREAELETRFQVWHTRLRHVAEPVAFSGGGLSERKAIEPHFDALLNFQLGSLRQRFFYRFVENLFSGHSDIPQYMQRLVTGQFSSRNVAFTPEGISPEVVVQGFMFERVAMYNDNTAHRLGSFTPTWRGWDGQHVLLLELLVALERGATTQSSLVAAPEGAGLEVRGLDLEVPGRPRLAAGLAFGVEASGLLISGPNACGKSLLGAVLLGLWPARGKGAAVLVPGLGPGAARPPAEVLLAAPQRPYLPMGTLGDQVCYPSRYAPGEPGREAAMQRALEAAGIGYLRTREAAGWMHTCRWEDVLSGGEQQRMGLARIFHRRPRFALLDECTSMVANDSEERLYRSLVQDFEVTPITLSQRLFMPEIHGQELKLGTAGGGGWSLSAVKGQPAPVA